MAATIIFRNQKIAISSRWTNKGLETKGQLLSTYIGLFVDVSVYEYSCHYIFCLMKLVVVFWPVWHNGRAFARDPKGRGFESRPVRLQVTAFDKLITRMCLCYQTV